MEPFVPAMGRKGRLAVGADADITVFDPARVIVGGTFVVRDEQLVPDVTPGRPVRRN